LENTGAYSRTPTSSTQRMARRFIAQEIVGDDRDIRMVAATFGRPILARGHALRSPVTSAPISPR